MAEKKKWIAGAIKNPGSLHNALNIAPGKKIPEKKIEKAEDSKNPSLRKKAIKGFHKK